MISTRFTSLSTFTTPKNSRSRLSPSLQGLTRYGYWNVLNYLNNSGIKMTELLQHRKLLI